MEMNTKFMKTTLCMTILLMLISACGFLPTFGSRRLITEKRIVSGFTRVDVSGSGSLDIIQDGTEALSVETDDNMMPFVTSQVRAGTLYLSLESSMRSLAPSSLHFTLHVKNLGGINSSGSWQVASDSLKTGSLSIVISGSGKVVVKSLTVDYLDTSISGSGELDLGGVVKQETISVSGSGRVLLGNLHATTAEVDISGSGSVTLWATETLTARISGSGNIKYYGSPRVSFNNSGSGSIHSLGEK
jgi:hypothetical protein